MVVPAEMKARANALIRSWAAPPGGIPARAVRGVVPGETGGDAVKTRAVLGSFFAGTLAALVPAYGIGKGLVVEKLSRTLPSDPQGHVPNSFVPVAWRSYQVQRAGSSPLFC